MSAMKKTRGRPSIFDDKFDVVNALKNLDTTSRFLKRRLLEKGYLVEEQEKGEGRGRPRKVYRLSTRGKSYVNLSKNWKSS